MTSALTITEKNRLSACEADIEKGGNLILSALKVVHEEKLYREEYGSWEDYCQERWGMSHRQCYRLLDKQRFLEAWSEHGDQECDQIGHISEGAVREVSDLPVETQVDVVREAAKRNGGKKPTAKQVREVRNEAQGERPAKISGGTSFDVEEIEQAPERQVDREELRKIDEKIDRSIGVIIRGIDDRAELLGPSDEEQLVRVAFKGMTTAIKSWRASR